MREQIRAFEGGEMRGFKVGVVGATGLVGREMLKILEQRNFPISTLRLFASDRSVGRRMRVRGEEIVIEEAREDNFEGLDFVLLAVGSEISRKLAPAAARAGAIVIDNSAAFRMDPEVPLVIPEVNPQDLESHKGIIANPNCATIQLLVALYPLHKVNRIKRIVVATYQSVSGWGAAAVEELREQTRRILQGEEELEPGVLPCQIGFNLFPQIDSFAEDDYTKEEWKMINETRKILHDDSILISATCVRVPVFVGHSEAVHVEFTNPITPQEAREILSEAPGVAVVDEPEKGIYPHPRMAAGRDEVFVGRIRRDKALQNGLAMWVVSDNLRKGAALNAVQIAEILAGKEGR